MWNWLVFFLKTSRSWLALFDTFTFWMIGHSSTNFRLFEIWRRYVPLRQ